MGDARWASYYAREMGLVRNWIADYPCCAVSMHEPTVILHISHNGASSVRVSPNAMQHDLAPIREGVERRLLWLHEEANHAGDGDSAAAD